MAETWNGNRVPASDDHWNLVPDIRTLAILNNRVIPVYSKSERDGIATDAPDGIIPDGTVALRMDQVSKGAMFDVFSDGEWHVGDTGIITSGISVLAAPNFKVDSYSFVRTGPMVTGRVDVTYTGPDIEGDSIGNIADITVFTLSADWAPIWATYDMSWSRVGRTQWFGRIDSNGVAALTHGTVGVTLQKTHTLRMDGSWRIA